MEGKLTSREYWESVWEGVQLPVVRRPGADFDRIFRRYLPASPEATMFEIGCAPGGWLAYFHKLLQYRVTGLEYVERAAEATRRNLEILGINGEVITADFFEMDLPEREYDLIFSGGFIEHFDDLAGVVRRLVMPSKDYVVTIIPNLRGINGWLTKTMRPDVFEKHRVISVELLRTLHEDAGLTTLFCNYAGGAILRPHFGVPLARWSPLAAKVANLPAVGFNFASRRLALVGIAPRTRVICNSLLYIGRR